MIKKKVILMGLTGLFGCLFLGSEKTAAQETVRSETQNVKIVVIDSARFSDQTRGIHRLSSQIKEIDAAFASRFGSLSQFEREAERTIHHCRAMERLATVKRLKLQAAYEKELEQATQQTVRDILVFFENLQRERGLIIIDLAHLPFVKGAFSQSPERSNHVLIEGTPLDLTAEFIETFNLVFP